MRAVCGVSARLERTRLDVSGSLKWPHKGPVVSCTAGFALMEGGARTQPIGERIPRR